MNGTRLVAFEEQVLCEGDTVAFRTSGWTFYSSVNPELANPYLYIVEQLDHVFESSAAAQVEDLQYPQEDSIDLTVSKLCTSQSCGTGR